MNRPNILFDVIIAHLVQKNNSNAKSKFNVAGMKEKRGEYPIFTDKTNNPDTAAPKSQFRRNVMGGITVYQ
ncbi:hypothetical protein [Pseudocnuella soli]